jgi:hypothetical protein
MLVDFAIKSELERSAAQEHTPPLSQVLVLLLAFSTRMIGLLDLYNKISTRNICSSGAHASPITGEERTERTSTFQIFYLVGWTLLQCPSH